MTLMDIQELRLTGDLIRLSKNLDSFEPKNDSEAYEKIISLISLNKTSEALELFQSFKWQDSISKKATQGLVNLSHNNLKEALEISLQAFEEAREDKFYLKLPYLLSLNASQQHLTAYEKIKYDIHRVNPNDSLFNVTLAEIFSAINMFNEARIYALRSLAVSNNNTKALRVLAICEFMSGDYYAARGYARKAFILSPVASIGNLLMACLSALGDPIGAIAITKTIKGDWTFDVYEQLGNAHISLGNFQKAEENYKKALEINPQAKVAIKGLISLYSELRRHYDILLLEAKHKELLNSEHDACTTMGYHYLNMGDRNTAFDYFRKATIISAAQPTVDNQITWPISEPRMRHEYQQLNLLKNRGRLNESSEKALKVLEKYVPEFGNPDTKFAPEDPIEKETLIQVIGSYHSIPDIPFNSRALASNDYGQIEHEFLTKETKLVVIDNFLTQEALENLRQFCEEANVWKRSYANGYHGAFMSTGFCSRVLLAIADELKIAMPKVVGPNILKQAWGFKYDQRMTGINLHADFAKVNTNFWITPDEACLDKNTGGLVVYDVPAPAHWSFLDYNAETEKIDEFLKQNNAKSIRVPYKMNRCVLFDSTYFHTTDEIHFKDGYENRRINCTLLYGQGLRNR